LRRVGDHLERESLVGLVAVLRGSANGFGTLFEMMQQEYQERENIFGNETDRRGISNEMMGEHDVWSWRDFSCSTISTIIFSFEISRFLLGRIIRHSRYRPLDS
jgi:hypothetical protein